MFIADTLKLSLRNFKTRKMRTLLTIMGISVGIGAILFLVSLGYGLQNVVLQRIATSDALLSLEIQSKSENLPLNKEAVDKISKINSIQEVSPLATFLGQASLGDLSGDIAINGINPSFFRLSGIKVKNGSIMSEGVDNEAVISTAGMRLFNAKDVAEIIGKEMELTIFVPKKVDEENTEVEIVKKEQKFKIVGVLEDDSSNFVFIPYQSISDLNITSLNQIKVKVSESKALESVRSDIIQLGFSVAAISDVIDQASKIFSIVQIVLALFGVIALIVSAIGMFNTMTIALLERTQEIGIMKALGATQRDVWQMFLFESVLMGFLGGIGGLGVGFLGGKLFNYGINTLASHFGGESLNVFQSPMWFIVVIVGTSAIVGLFTGLYPARRAGRLNPLVALRYK